MSTRLLTDPTEAATHIKAGQVVAFPTETVYGLGADALNPKAVQRIFEAKGRPSDNPLIVHVAETEDVLQVAATVPPLAKRLLERFAPGPLTLILPRRADVPLVVTAGLDTVGVRIPAHPVAHAFLTACETPVAAPSANPSGRPSPTSWEAVAVGLNGRIAAILKGGRADVGLESTVVDCTTRPPSILRAGAVTLTDLRSVAPVIKLAPATGPVRSPGQKHRHYTPSAAVHLVERPDEASPDTAHAFIGIEAPAQPSAFGRVAVCADVAAYAHTLFDFFFQCDRDGVERIYCQRVAPEGLGLALMDRMERAAAR
ncbi:MAG: threonylcarbamoyl-AMP synthase [Bacteroidetes bacterium]|nr:threonylcarbamoyl-AMP synthase [Bacteroidota bacterium]